MWVHVDHRHGFVRALVCMCARTRMDMCVHWCARSCSSAKKCVQCCTHVYNEGCVEWCMRARTTASIRVCLQWCARVCIQRGADMCVRLCNDMNSAKKGCLPGRNTLFWLQQKLPFLDSNKSLGPSFNLRASGVLRLSVSMRERKSQTGRCYCMSIERCKSHKGM